MAVELVEVPVCPVPPDPACPELDEPELAVVVDAVPVGPLVDAPVCVPVLPDAEPPVVLVEDEVPVVDVLLGDGVGVGVGGGRRRGWCGGRRRSG